MALAVLGVQWILSCSVEKLVYEISGTCWFVSLIMLLRVLMLFRVGLLSPVEKLSRGM